MTPTDDLVPEPESDAGAGQGSGEEEDVYALRDEPAKPGPEVAYVPRRDYRDPQAIAERAAESAIADEAEESVWTTVRHAPPRSLFFANTFSFPFCPTARLQTMVLAGGAIVAFAALRIGFGAGDAVKAASATASATASDSGGSWLFAVLGLILLLAWLVVASVYGLTVLRDTSQGADSIEKWPRLYVFDSVSTSVYILLGLAVGVLPGLVFSPLWAWLGWPKLLMMSLSAVALLPLLLLSMLETNSPKSLVEPPVWHSVLTAWRAWGPFYLITAPSAVLVFLLTAGALKYTWIFGPLLAGVLLAVVWMVYFRLLGRLVWFCSGRSTEVVE